MKIAIFTLLFMAMLLVVSEETMAQDCKPKPNQVVVFENGNYEGRCVVLEPGEYPNFKSMGFSDNSARAFSMIVGTEVELDFCLDPDFKGECGYVYSKARFIASPSFKFKKKTTNSAASAGARSFLITTNSIGGFELGMTVGEAKNVSGGFRLGPMPGPENSVTIGAYDGKGGIDLGVPMYPEFDFLYKPSNENDRIEYLATEDPRNKTADGVHVGMTIADAEKILGKLSELSACWGTESGSFSKAPAEFRFAFKGTDGMAGDYGTKELSWQECTKTDKYSEGAIISLISVSKPKKKE